ncbi:hypothetical protein [Microcoleus sp. herbarium12]|uniref:hypothetical protein n=1 Tax=Microcoleus sp. herbarium12 TaxID=3055437 RepID=UPI002FCF7FA9
MGNCRFLSQEWGIENCIFSIEQSAMKERHFGWDDKPRVAFLGGCKYAAKI